MVCGNLRPGPHFFVHDCVGEGETAAPGHVAEGIAQSPRRTVRIGIEPVAADVVRASRESPVPPAIERHFETVRRIVRLALAPDAVPAREARAAAAAEIADA